MVSQKKLTEESLKTKRARNKLKKRLVAFDEKITEKALGEKSIEIHKWISRHADRRVTLKDKSISLFDENQNAAFTSEKITKIARQLQDFSE